MSEAWQPTLDDITKAFMDLAGRVSNSNGAALDPYVHQALRDVAFHLELYIPGLELPPDGEIAGALARASQAALDRGDCPDSLAHALRGLAHSPHDPGLFYLVASACFESLLVSSAICFAWGFRSSFTVRFCHAAQVERSAHLDFLIIPYCAGSSPDAGTPTYKLVPKKMPVRTPTAEGPMKDRHLPFPGPAPSRRVTGVELDESSGELGSGRMRVTSSPS